MTSATASARDPIVDSGEAVIAANGVGAPASSASITSRISPEEENASRTSPSRHGNAPPREEARRDAQHLGPGAIAERGEPERHRGVVGGAVSRGDDPAHVGVADQSPRRRRCPRVSVSVCSSVAGIAHVSRQRLVSRHEAEEAIAARPYHSRPDPTNRETSP